jgi:hypothetical protein
MDFKPSKCIRCLAEVALETFLRNDHVCDTCAEASPAEEYRYRSNDDQQAAAIAAMGEA